MNTQLYSSYINVTHENICGIYAAIYYLLKSVVLSGWRCGIILYMYANFLVFVDKRRVIWAYLKALRRIYWLIDWIVFYAVSAIFQPCNGRFFLWNVIDRDNVFFESLRSLFDSVIIWIHAFLKQSVATLYVMMLENVLQIQLGGERTPKL